MLVVLTGMWFYVRLAFWPAGLSFDYLPINIKSTVDFAVVAGMVSVAAMLALAGATWRVDRRVTFGIGWFLVTLLPVSNIIPIKTVYNDRFLYEPLVGMCIAVGGVVLLMARRWKPWARVTGVILGLAVATVMAWGTVERNKDWQSSEKLMLAALKVDRGNGLALLEMGVIYMDRKDEATARQWWQKGMEANPRNWFAAAQLGWSYFFEGDRLLKGGKKKEGEAAFDKAMPYLEIAKGMGPTYYQLGAVLACMGSIDEYRGEFEKAKLLLRAAINVDPTCVMAYLKLIRMLEKGDEDERKEALAVVVRAHQACPGDTDITSLAVRMLVEAHMPLGAEQVMQETINALAPGSAERQKMETRLADLRRQLGERRRTMTP
jgi:tetratricopeptide (TPR) repeat protein